MYQICKMIISESPIKGNSAESDLFQETATFFLVDTLHSCYDNSQTEADSQDKEHPVDTLQHSCCLLSVSNLR